MPAPQHAQASIGNGPACIRLPVPRRHASALWPRRPRNEKSHLAVALGRCAHEAPQLTSWRRRWPRLQRHLQPCGRPLRTRRTERWWHRRSAAWQSCRRQEQPGRPVREPVLQPVRVRAQEPALPSCHRRPGRRQRSLQPERTIYSLQGFLVGQKIFAHDSRRKNVTPPPVPVPARRRGMACPSLDANARTLSCRTVRNASTEWVHASWPCTATTRKKLYWPSVRDRGRVCAFPAPGWRVRARAPTPEKRANSCAAIRPAARATPGGVRAHRR